MKVPPKQVEIDRGIFTRAVHYPKGDDCPEQYVYNYAVNDFQDVNDNQTHVGSVYVTEDSVFFADSRRNTLHQFTITPRGRILMKRKIAVDTFESAEQIEFTRKYELFDLAVASHLLGFCNQIFGRAAT